MLKFLLVIWMAIEIKDFFKQTQDFFKQTQDGTLDLTRFFKIIILGNVLGRLP